MKKIINKIFNQFGYSINKFNRSDYNYLLNIPRYKKTVINIFGANFEIADSHSFYFSHREIFIDEIYKFQCDHENPTIIDCGSSYGTSIIYFKQLYPDAKIVGVEADPEIFQILKKNINLRSYKNVVLLNKAISHVNGPINFFSEGADGGRIHTMDEPRRIYKVDTVALDDLIDGQIDFLKMDIEGAETNVLCASRKLDNVKQLFIEYHSFIGEKQKLVDLLSCLQDYNFRYYIHTQFCSKKPLIENETQLGMDLQLNILAKRC